MYTKTPLLGILFHRQVRNVFECQLGIQDAELVSYISQVLCNFSEGGSLFLTRGAKGHPLDELRGMVMASDPVFGNAPSFQAERAMRKYIGDYALFTCGMVPEAVRTDRNCDDTLPSLDELIRIGKQSYHVVSQFNVFEYKLESHVFARLSSRFEKCVFGLSQVREELSRCLKPSKVAA